MVMETFPLAALLGWPAIAVANVFVVIGFQRRRPSWVIVAAAAALPMSLYLAVMPRYPLIPLFIPLSLVVAALAIRRDRPRLAAALCAPLPLFYAAVAYQISIS